MIPLQLPQHDDTLLYDLWFAGIKSATVSVADEIGLFSALELSKSNLDNVAKKLSISCLGLKSVSRILCNLGLINLNDQYISLTPVSGTYLIPSSPYYWGTILSGLRQRDEHKRLLTALRTDQHMIGHKDKSFTKMWQSGDITYEAAQNFTECMHNTIFAPAVSAVKDGIFDSTQRLLDMGGGSGAFCIAFMAQYPDRQVTIFDLPPVCKAAEKYLQQYEISKKVTTYPGDFFINSWPRGHDSLLLSNILHDWPKEAIEDFINKAYKALDQGGHIYIHEMLLNDDKIGPMAVACFDLLMFMNHRSQQFSAVELSEILLKVGFSQFEVKKTFGYFSIIKAKK